jgi:hypothetical protein
MTTKAEKLEKSTKVPANLQEAANEVSSTIKEGFRQLDIHRSLDENQLQDPDARRGKEALEFAYKHHGLHAYRYENLDDGSCIALWSNTPDGIVKIKAFKDIQEASQWSPRDER